MTSLEVEVSITLDAMDVRSIQWLWILPGNTCSKAGDFVDPTAFFAADAHESPAQFTYARV